MKLQGFHNLIDLLTYFNSEAVCSAHLANLRWADGVIICPKCQCNKVHKCATRYKCSGCKAMFSVRVGTMFEDSRLPLQKWFAAIYLITAHKKGISSCQLARDLGVTQKTGWFLLHRVRHALGLPQTEQLQGTIEADETFIGGKEKNKHKHKQIDNAQGRSVKGKSAVAGLYERDGELRAKKIPDTRGYNLRPFVIENVAFDATLKTDEFGGYNGLNQLFQHHRVAHMEGVYVDGDTHTNNLEGFWSQLKRSIYGCYHSVSEKHLQQYIDESVFRFNTREFSEDGRFNAMLSHISTHINYKQLTKNDSETDNRQTLPEPNLFS